MLNKKDYAYKVTAAGRINIIGEHIDYCGGKVMPAAISLKNAVYIRPNGTDKINLSWTTLPDKVSLDIGNLESYRGLKYGNYQAGSALMWKNAGHRLVGCDMLQECTVPFGSGLSSSAAIEVSTIAALATVADEKFDPVEIALLAQKAERDFAGVNCGIMDQYASACGKKDNAMLLNCSTLGCEYLPLKLGKYSLVLIDSNKPHNLAESKYNERRAETEEALKILQKVLDVGSLSEISPEQFKMYSTALPQLLRRRVLHVVEECNRVEVAKQAVQASNMQFLGKLLNRSHASLAKLYEVTDREIDCLVELAQNYPACVGSRMMGGGFGGCIISIVETDSVEEFKESVCRNYYKQTRFNAKSYEVEIADGITVEKI